FQDRRNDVDVGAAATDIATHPVAHGVLVDWCPFGTELVEHTERRADLARRAVAALNRVVLDERLLQRMQLSVPREPLDRRDLGVLAGDRENEAAVHPATVEQHGARAALAVIAALLRPREAEVLAQRVEERR